MKLYNKMKSHRSGLLIAVAALVTGLSACTKNFESYNTDNTGVSNGQFGPDYNALGLYLKSAQMAIYNFSGGGDPNSYQLQQNLNADCYSGYFMTPNAFGNANNTNYSLVSGWNGETYKAGYLSVMSPILSLKATGIEQKTPAVWAVAQIVQVTAMARVTDVYGPIPYKHVGEGLSTVPYDSQQDVYNQFFTQLDAATQALRTQINSGAKLPFAFATFDLVYDGDFTKWLRFANSLRLRLAMHIRNVDQATAKIQAEKALDPANGGLITDNNGNMAVKVTGNFTNPLVFIAQNWADIRIGASIQCYLTGYKDPRIARYMDKSTDADPALAGKYKGIRIGSVVDKDKYKTYSNLNLNDGTPAFSLKTAPVLMTTAEVYFLRAEAALQGWSNAGGTAQQLYEQGIATSMQQWNVTAPGYINDATSTPDAYTDPKNSANDAPKPSAITIKWDDAASPAVKQERISTQKWIAMFPEGQEGWTEFRRTGYPKLFEVVVNKGLPAISSSLQIRRLPFPQNEYNTNPQTVADAVKLLNGPDNGGTPLWWDTRK